MTVPWMLGITWTLGARIEQKSAQRKHGRLSESQSLAPCIVYIKDYESVKRFLG